MPSEMNRHNQGVNTDCHSAALRGNRLHPSFTLRGGRMYFWNVRSLETELKKRSLSQRDKYKYFLSFMIITVFGMESSLYLAEEPTFIMLSQSLSVLLLTIIGTIYCFKVNDRGDSNEFIERYICLFLPIFIRVSIFFVISFSAYMIIGFALYGDMFDTFTDKINWVDVIFTIGFECVFYWYLASSFRRVAINI